MGCTKSKSKRATAPMKMSESSLSVSKVIPKSLLNIRQEDPLEAFTDVTLISSSNRSEVFKCLDKSTRMLRILKRISKNKSENQLNQNIERPKEIKVWQVLDYPNLPRCYGLNETGDYHYIVMDFCEGERLTNKLREFQETEEKISIIMRQILSTVAYLHSKRIAHRNIDPNHILIEDGSLVHIKLVGFGKSTFLTGQKMMGQQGTSYFMSPEMIRGYYNEKCDEWSCGMIMYILLTGNIPYEGKSDIEIVEEIKTRPFQLNLKELKGISSQAILLLQHLLEIDPIARISASIALTHPWLVQANKKDSGISGIIGKLRKYESQTGLSQVVSEYISQTIEPDDEKEIIKAFQVFDTNRDGIISKKELLEGFSHVEGIKNAHGDVDRLISKIAELSETISYSEFLTLCLEQSKYVSKDNLFEIFKNLDINSQGKIAESDLKKVLDYKNKVSEEEWRNIITEADSNKDGYVDFDEFVASMNRK
ncbi:unnamed protein product [Blepharisma stoltei]|uniref:Calcium-dependent protein kinase n=1 Tax=Blepharisma stoltei TaxID=1481888 RepID=A0AAU9IYX2_9CILI|nr:unnamed protein product [Blepharisma stoltei]